MGITLQCSNADCKVSHHVPDELSGKRVKCRLCGAIVSVPELGPGLGTPARHADATSNNTREDNDPFHAAPIRSDASWLACLPVSPSPPQPPVSLQRIGRFEIVRRLGVGGFGTVYLAHDSQLDRPVALKVPRAGTLDDPEVRERFFREARAAARLQHPYIVPVYDAGDDQGQSYIASAFINGRTLSDLLKENPPNPRAAAEIVRKLADALHYAHLQGIIHRDVKPANVMIDDNGDPHLMDFGLARLEHSAAQLTQDGTVMGTPAYMSPEQAAGVGDQVTPASDQYSLGVVLYQLLAGRTPFDGPPQVVIYNVLHRPIPNLRSVKQDIARDLETVCTKSLARLTADRYATCEDFADDLGRWLRDDPVRARPMGVTERFFRWCRREPLVAGLSAAIVLVMAIGFVVSSVQWVRAEWETKRANDAVEQEKQSAQAAKESEEREKIAAAEANRAAEEARTIAAKLDTQRQELIAATVTAKRQAKEAIASDQKANQAVREFEKKLADAMRRLYQAKVRLAAECLKSGNRSSVIPYLEEARSQVGNPDRRGWEWFYLLSLAESQKTDSPGSQEFAINHSFEAPTDATWSSDGSLIAVASTGGGRFGVWSGLIAKSIWTYKGKSVEAGENVWWENLDSKLMVFGNTAGTDAMRASKSLVLVDIRSKQEEVLATECFGAVKSPADGRFLVFREQKSNLGGPFEVVILDPEGQPPKKIMAYQKQPSAFDADWSLDGRRVSFRISNRISIWDESDSRLLEIDSTGTKGRIAPNADRLAMVLADRVHVWNIDLKKMEPYSMGHNGAVTAFAWTPAGNRLASVGSDGFLKIWNPDTGDELFSTPCGVSGARGMKWSDDGMKLAIWGANEVRMLSATLGYKRAGVSAQ